MEINDKILSQIVDLILKYKKPEKIVLFGSRANGEFSKTSDIDIAIFGKTWDNKNINIVKHTLEEKIKTPLKFDVLNFYSLTKNKLKERILKEGKILHDAEA